jgi:hypothetical protein
MSGTYEIWTEQEDQMIRDYYPEYGAQIHEWLPGRTEKAVHRRAYRMGISGKRGTKARYKKIPYLDPITRHWLTHDWGLKRAANTGG